MERRASARRVRSREERVMVKSTEPLRRFPQSPRYMPSGPKASKAPLWDRNCDGGFRSASTCSTRNRVTDFQAWDFCIFSTALRYRHKSQSMAIL